MDWVQFEIESDRPLVPDLVVTGGGKYWPGPILCRLDFNYESAAKLFKVPGLSWAYLTCPASLVTESDFPNFTSWFAGYGEWSWA